MRFLHTNIHQIIFILAKYALFLQNKQLSPYDVAKQGSPP